MSAEEKKVIDIEFDTPGELEEAFNTHISKGGYFVPSEEPAARTTPVELRFHLPGVTEPLAVSGEVAYQATKEAPMPGMGPGMAIQFRRITDQMSKAFQAAITIARAEGMEAEDQEGPTEWEDDSEDDEEEDHEEQGEEQQAKEGEDAGPGDEVSAQKLLASLSNQSSENLYFAVKKMSMHQKIVAAKRGNRAVRNILLKEGNKKVLKFLLQNPKFGASEVLQMLKMPNLPMDLVQVIAKNSTWSQSEEVKYQIVTNPKTPMPLAMNVLSSLNQNSLAKIAKSGAAKVQIKSSALKLLEQRRKTS